jgi:DNA-nicking Smr family endonuclease
MKRAKKLVAKANAKKAAKKQASAEAPPERLYRPFEKLAQKGKGAPAAKSAEPRSKPAAAKGSATKPGKAAAPAQKGGGGGGDGSEQAATEAETFAIYMAGVRALEDKATRIPRSASRIERAAKGTLPPGDADAPARAELKALVAEGIRFETSDDGERIEGRRIEVEPREVRRLRRGQYTVDQQIDLHGMNAGDARKAMEQFIEKRKKEGDRVLRVIHGKGGHSPRGVSVLRGEIAAWLSQGPAKRHIAAFATAPPEDGGAGALLVLLMRGRS